MKIENFLNDFDEHNKRSAEAKIKEQNAKDKQKMENEKYLSDFDEYYVNTIIPKIKQIETKIKDKFQVNFPNEPDLSQRSYFYKIELTPNFTNYVEKVQFEIIVEGERRLITFSGSAYGSDEKNLNIKGLNRFQDEIEEFKKVDLENEVSEILNKIFLLK